MYGLLFLLSLASSDLIAVTAQPCMIIGPPPQVEFELIHVKKRAPMTLWEDWFNEAKSESLNVQPAVFTLSTVQRNGHPAARHVGLVGYDTRGFKFCTDYTSPKALQLVQNSWTAIVFLWWVKRGNANVSHQVRVEGYATRLSRSENEDYFYKQSNYGQARAIVQKQSECIGGTRRIEIKKEISSIIAILQSCPAYRFPVPVSYGCYLIHPVTFEFYQSAANPNNIADRVKFIKKADYTPSPKPCRVGTTDSEWVYEHLEP